MTASDEIECPVICLSYFSCMGQTMKDFEVVIHSMPRGGNEHFPIEGLLGMDFLRQFNLNISFSDSYIDVSPIRSQSRRTSKNRPKRNRKRK